jgi:NADP-dependent 3-hydroxy acid dehydrogenase YdfG
MGNKALGGRLQANLELQPEPVMPADKVGEAVAFMANQPDGTNILSLMVMATAMPFVGRG